jgi:hypothetical protein
VLRFGLTTNPPVKRVVANRLHAAAVASNAENALICAAQQTNFETGKPQFMSGNSSIAVYLQLFPILLSDLR